MGEKRNAYRILRGKLGGKKSLERPGHRWENNSVSLRNGSRACTRFI
jgi:hypothetical protein